MGACTCVCRMEAGNICVSVSRHQISPETLCPDSFFPGNLHPMRQLYYLDGPSSHCSLDLVWLKGKKPSNVIYPIQSLLLKSLPQSLQHANPTDSTHHSFGKAGWREESRGRCREKTDYPVTAFSPYEDWWRGATMEAQGWGRLWKTKGNQTH